MSIELTRQEINNVTGGIVAEIITVGSLVGGYSLFKTWQNGACVEWEKAKWASKSSCYMTNAVEDAMFFGAALTLVATRFHPPEITPHIRKTIDRLAEIMSQKQQAQKTE